MTQNKPKTERATRSETKLAINQPTLKVQKRTHSPSETFNGSDSTTFTNVRLPISGESAQIPSVSALETMAEWSGLQDTSTSSKPNAEGKEDGKVHSESQSPVEDTEEKTNNGGEKKQAQGVLVLGSRIVFSVSTVLVNLLRYKTKQGNVDTNPECEENHIEDMAGGAEESSNRESTVGSSSFCRNHHRQFCNREVAKKRKNHAHQGRWEETL